jgi:DNA-binding transcriptional regulator YdaS (Cro superfamily)
MTTPITQAVEAMGGQTELARRLRVTQGAVWQWLHDRRPVPPRRAIEIERLTAGAVRADSLCDGFEFERDPTGAVMGYRVRVPFPAANAEAA